MWMCSIFTGKQSCKWGEQRAFQWVGGDLDKPQTFLSRIRSDSPELTGDYT